MLSEMGKDIISRTEVKRVSNKAEVVKDEMQNHSRLFQRHALDILICLMFFKALCWITSDFFISKMKSD